MSVIRCDVVAKNKVLFSGELYNVMVPGTEGELGIMENHEPLRTASSGPAPNRRAAKF